MVDRFDDILIEMRRERAEWGARFDVLQQQTAENLRFLGELNRRGEIALQDLVRSQREMRREIRAETAEIKASTAKIEASTETTKAHTRAIFALIDRLEGGGLSPAG